MIKSKKITDNLTVSDFKTVRFMTAEGKLQIAKAWEKFMRARCAGSPVGAVGDFPRCPTFWTSRLYKHFHLHLGYIAHFNRHGFYDAQWCAPDDFRRNVKMLASNQTHCGPLHSGAWGANVDYEDLGVWIVKVASAYLGEALARSDTELQHKV